MKQANQSTCNKVICVLNNDVLQIDVSSYPDLMLGTKKSSFTNAGFVLNRNCNLYEMPILEARTKLLLHLQKNLQRKRYELVDESGVIERAVNEKQAIDETTQRLHHAAMIKRNPTTTTLKLPYFNRKLLPFQENIVKHSITAINSANFSVPGAGKTTMIYASYCYHKHVVKKVNKILVVCPMSAFEAWIREFEECFGYKPSAAYLNGPKRKVYYEPNKHFDLYLINHATLSNDLELVKGLLTRDNYMIVADESHYFKNFSPNATWANDMLQIAPYGKVRIIASGTPAPNKETDFWSQITFLVGSELVLGNRQSFSTQLEMATKKEKLMDMINAISHRVTKADLNLPPTETMVVPVEMMPIQRKLYDLLAKEISDEVAGFDEADRHVYVNWCRAKIIRLRQISSNPALLKNSIDDRFVTGQLVDYVKNYEDYEQSSKFTKTVEIAMSHVQKGERVLIWSDFVQNIKDLHTYFKNQGVKVFHVYGEIPKEATDEVTDSLTRDNEINGFRENKGSVLIANPQTLAESVSLHHHCHVAIYMDWSFNAAHSMQSRDRIHRVGLDSKILTKYYYIKNKNSVDKVILQRLEEKELRMNTILANEVPVATGEFNGCDFGEEADFKAVLQHINTLVGDQHGSI
ncbi:DEAD/DEAH box helicase [Bacillus cereus]